jgi:hypothetical protein
LKIPRHFLPDGSPTRDAIRVKLYPHRLGGEVIEINLNRKYMLLALRLSLQFAEVERSPILLQPVFPISQSRADFAFIGYA